MEVPSLRVAVQVSQLWVFAGRLSSPSFRLRSFAKAQLTVFSGSAPFHCTAFFPSFRKYLLPSHLWASACGLSSSWNSFLSSTSISPPVLKISAEMSFPLKKVFPGADWLDPPEFFLHIISLIMLYGDYLLFPLASPMEVAVMRAEAVFACLFITCPSPRDRKTP